MDIWSEETVTKWHRHYDDAALYWAKWADQLADQQQKLNVALLQAADVRCGDRLLDLASGAGEPTVTAAGLVSDQGEVVATDVSEPMLVALRERLVRLRLGNVSAEFADMEALPFPDTSFDAVTCRYGLMYAADPRRAVAEAARVVRPGRRIGFMVWGPEHDNSVVFHGLRVANDALGGPISESEFAAPTRLSESGAVAQMLKAEELHDVREVEIVFEPRIRVGIPFWIPLLEMNASSVWNALTAEQQQTTNAAIERAYQAFRRDDYVHLKTSIKVISGRR